MAIPVNGVWAIDIGNCSLKALKLLAGQDCIEAVSLDYIEHSRILSAPGVEPAMKEQIIAETLRQFLSRNDVKNNEVAIAIAGQNSFARFIKLPPVEPKKIPEIVQFEAVQQIPFDINEVEWDWQLMETPGSPDIEVGIFAIKNELIGEIIDHFTREDLRVACVQIEPIALFNYLVYDRADLADVGQKAAIVLDIGAENSTLVICTRHSVWQRSIRIGGNSFTQAIAGAFKTSFEKAEKLKRAAPVSKYMRQIYTAMKPVYTELSGEIQRSLGFYASSGSGRDKGFSRIIAIGGGMKLQGLAKYLQQSLGIPLIKPDSFERLKPAADVSAARFHENICDFGVVYGLGVQTFGHACIDVNLLPKKIARAMAWTRKARGFSVAAATMLLVTFLALGRTFRDRAGFNANQAVRTEITSVIDEARSAISSLSEAAGQDVPLDERIQKQFDLFKYRDIVPALNEALIACLPNKNNSQEPQQKGLFEAFDKGDVATIMKTPRSQRKMVFITRVYIEFHPDLTAATFPQVNTAASPKNNTAMQGMMMRRDVGMSSPSAGYSAMDMPGAEAPEQAPKSGFVVVIEGFSPYKKIAEILDPSGVAGDQSRWGIVTRFENLSKIVGGTPFELFDKKDTANFSVKWDLLDLEDKQMPAGIGVLKEIRRAPESTAKTAAPAGSEMMMYPGTAGTRQSRLVSEKVLVDPMTSEEISKTFDIITETDVAASPELSEKDIGRKKYTAFGKEMFIERDSWFRIQAKFVWKDAPQITPAESGDMSSY